MPIASVDERRVLGSALGLRVATASSEPTARWVLCGVGQSTFDDLQAGTTLRIDFGNRVEQCLGVWHFHVRKKVNGGGLLNNFTGVHHCHIVGIARHDTEVMGH